ncbi:MAG: PEP-CTERM sorting domain-containing protein [Gammaproteobacteria bacterium]|nr:PEP-CTERM sorting domain-containing protein [Gammaproteobacteria bacterium]
MKTITQYCWLMLLTATLAGTANAGIIHDEGASGDLSDNNLAPTALAIAPGSNIVTGSTTASPLDRDIFSITIAAGQELVAILLDTYNASDDQSFFAVAAGNTVSSLVSLPALLGNALIGATAGAMEGDDVLDDLGALTFAGSTGFSGALGPGTYTFWLQETTVGIPGYALDFQVRGGGEIPLPATVWLLLPALLMLRRARPTALTSSR